MSSARNFTLEDIIRRYIERYPDRVDMLLTLMEFWSRLHSLNENISELLHELRRENARMAAEAAAVDAAAANGGPIVEFPPDTDDKPEEKHQQAEEDDTEEGATGGQPR
ncbi:uncharacterized protein LOC126299359 isoform X3 [Schistocerca gregaria]|uniref:uncharacterized protein LOC126299359 isoform X3 n=1 Tax=Schistocerca gregaria TaxID=7010 RepID=UPI00211ECCE8|nr:uncharacterized protein LOC126299359 isoform X3 [Schistocerca gregaria]